jgi:hypothetical protein
MYMNVKSFLFTLLETPMSYIDWNDKMFLFEVLEGYTSAYAMDKKHIKEYEEKKLSDPDNAEQYKPLAYQNLRLRFKKYHQFGILERITTIGDSEHARKDFKVSEKGLVFLIADGMHPDIHTNFEYFAQSNLFKTFIFPYFESHIFEQSTLSLIGLIEYYLEDVCLKINNALNPQLLEEYGYNPALPLSEQYDWKSGDPEEDPSYIILPIWNLLIQLETTHKSLILDLVSMNEKILNNHNPKPTKQDKIKTIQLLSKDKIFMKEFKKIKTDIDNSYNKLLNV